MEAHFVHRADSGALAVVGVLMMTDKANAAFSRIVSTMPAAEGPAVKADPRINPNMLLPARHRYYRYSGSLTTPPCAEIVEWLLLTDPIHVASADVARFAKLYPLNARPVQKDNRRYVLVFELCSGRGVAEIEESSRVVRLLAVEYPFQGVEVPLRRGRALVQVIAADIPPGLLDHGCGKLLQGLSGPHRVDLNLRGALGVIEPVIGLGDGFADR